MKLESAPAGHWSREPACPVCFDWKLRPLLYGGYTCDGCGTVCYQLENDDGRESWKLGEPRIVP
jgi:hypothetical protein